MRAVRIFALVLGLAAVVLVMRSAIEASAFDVASLASHTPYPTALMRARRAEARRLKRPYRIDQRVVPYDWISPRLRHAVLIAEDDAFFSHGGLDWGEIRDAARRNLERGRVVRGASTITQQLARNLYLGEERTLTRKLKEVFLALRLERALSKRRILELYLNLIEWGDGIFGVEAASERYFGVSADALDPRQAILLAAIIINPHRYSPLAPTPRIENRLRMIATRMRRRGLLDEDEYLAVVRAPAEHPGVSPGWTPWEAPDTSRVNVAAPADGGPTGPTPADTAAGTLPPD